MLIRFLNLLGLGLLLAHCHSESTESALKIAGASASWNPDSLSSPERAQLFASLSKAAYCGPEEGCSVEENLDSNFKFFALSQRLQNWKLEFLSARDASKDIEGYIIYHPDAPEVYITIRGSEDLSQSGGLQDWFSTNSKLIPGYFPGKSIRGNVHVGYLDGMYGLWHPNDTGLLKVLKEKNLWDKTYYLSGHSLGGAVATLVGMRLAEEGQNVAGIYTYGAPRLAFWDFQDSFNRQLKEKTHNFINPKDPIPRLLLNFVSVGQSYILNQDRADSTDKDGAAPWDPLTAFFTGDIYEHSLDPNVPQGYFQSLKKLSNLPQPNPVPPVTSPSGERFEPEEGRYLLVNQHSGKCLNLNVTVLNQTGFDNLEKIQQYDCPRTQEEAWTNNFWQLKKEGDQAYSIVSSYSDKCVDLDSSRGGKGDGARVQQYDCTNRQDPGNRNWYFVKTESADTYYIESAWSGKCLEISVTAPERDGFQNKAPTQQWQCKPRTYDRNQRWKLVQING